MSDTLIQVRVEEELKRDTIKVLEKLGIDLPAAIRLYLKKIVMEEGLPFEVKLRGEQRARGHKIEYIPAKPAKYVLYSEYLGLVSRVPGGKVTRDEDIKKYLERKYEAERIEIEYDCYNETFGSVVPLWRIVSTRGVLSDTREYTREQQKELLEKEGLSVIPCGAYGRSLMVKDYKKHLFCFKPTDY